MPLTRQKRKSEAQDEETPETKRCFSNLTNFKSPKSRKIPKNANDCKKLTNCFSQNVKKPDQATAVSAPASEVSSTQYDEIVISQLPPELVPKSNDEIVSMIRSIKKVMELDFKNVAERLQLQSIPPYLYNLKEYQKRFAKNAGVQHASRESEYLAKNFLTEDRFCLFIQYVRNSMCGCNEFPGHIVICGILELILVS